VCERFERPIEVIQKSRAKQTKTAVVTGGGGGGGGGSQTESSSRGNGFGKLVDGSDGTTVSDSSVVPIATSVSVTQQQQLASIFASQLGLLQPPPAESVVAPSKKEGVDGVEGEADSGSATRSQIEERGHDQTKTDVDVAGLASAFTHDKAWILSSVAQSYLGK
jgi:hypothetical protein